MGSVGKSTANQRETTSTTESKYDYSGGTIQDAVDSFQKATGIKVKPEVISKSNEALLRDVLSDLHKGIDAGVKISNLGIYTKQNALAASDGTNIYINPKYYGLSKEAFAKIVKEGYDTKFHPTADPSSIVIHEMGHNLANMMLNKQLGITNGYADYDTVVKYTKERTNAKSWDKASMEKSVIKDAIKQSGLKATLKGNQGMKELCKNISGYGGSSPAEAIAEAYADVQCNGAGANVLSKAIINVLKSRI